MYRNSSGLMNLDLAFINGRGVLLQEDRTAGMLFKSIAEKGVFSKFVRGGHGAG
jgi:hypothetical protein